MYSHQGIIFPKPLVIFVLSIDVLLHAESNFNWNNLNYFDENQSILSEVGHYPNPLEKSPLFPSLVRSLFQQKHAPDIAKLFFREYDYIVVGSGAGGSVVASRLSEVPCVNVLLLEAGKSPSILTDLPSLKRYFAESDIDWNYTTVPQKHAGYLLRNKQVLLPSGKVVGGSSVINGMEYVRGNRKNYDKWAANGATGWSYDDVLPYFKKIENNQNPEAVDKGYHGFSGPVQVEIPVYNPILKTAVLRAAKRFGYPIRDINGAYQIGTYDVQYNMRGGQRCSSAKAYLVPVEQRSNIQILANAFVTKILIENGVAKGVQFDLNGETYQVMVRREVIVSAGAINSAKLLMLSGIGPRQHLQSLRIPVVADLPVGQNLHDHVKTTVPFEMASSIRSYSEKMLDPKNIQRYINRRIGPLASTSLSVDIFIKHSMKSLPDDVPDYLLYFMEGGPFTPRTRSNIIPHAYKQLFGPYENKTTFFCVPEILHPLSRGTVTLRSANPYDKPYIDPNYYAHPQDLRDMIEGMKDCFKIAATKPMKQIGAKPFTTVFPWWSVNSNYLEYYLKLVAKSIVLTSFHYVGTAKMGDSRDLSTVVDHKLRVKGIKGLRVVDASITPIIPSGNTYQPTMMIGEKGADMIKKTIDCRFSNTGSWYNNEN